AFRQGEQDPGGDAEVGADFMEQDVAAARAAGDAKSHSPWAALLVCDRRPYRMAGEVLLVLAGRESRLLPPGSVDHVAGKEESPMRCLPRGRLLVAFRGPSDGRQGGLHVRGQDV